MSLSQFLTRLARVLEQVQVPWMLSGSLASAFHGTPRSTQDVDIIVVLTRERLGALLAALPEDVYYVSDTAAREALARAGQFNVIDLETGWKADLILRKPRPFSLVEFGRRVERQIMGVRVPVCTPEDIILSKLEWAQKMGGSERQLGDARGVLELRRAELDFAYLEHWATELGITDLWESLRGAQ